ncbi:hypothetical protein QGM71_01870 [Virgibacillus sp. C22-A2]|uniref:LysM domain-containing protein n=2 Tax=Virgibacillus tibetensis TaxID=3042313 RepID=A0ABU6KAN2_9BACI|nr:hypothetical protein [Virgibacillus sp. C22-A2]
MNSSTPTAIIKFNVIHIKVQPGDTVLSIVEELNEDTLDSLDISQLISDFKMINPNSDPYNLQAHHYYYFPLYTDTNK